MIIRGALLTNPLILDGRTEVRHIDRAEKACQNTKKKKVTDTYYREKQYSSIMRKGWSKRKDPI